MAGGGGCPLAGVWGGLGTGDWGFRLVPLLLQARTAGRVVLGFGSCEPPFLCRNDTGGQSGNRSEVVTDAQMWRLSICPSARGTGPGSKSWGREWGEKWGWATSCQAAHVCIVFDQVGLES